jgi:threonine dehydrogenase-like Zn-dependent dehydrogenase
MKAVVFNGVGEIALEDVRDPRIEESTDALVTLTASAICGTDLHMIRGTMGDMAPGTVLGHEGVGLVAEVGRDVRNFKAGDRVVIGSTIGCGSCVYCRAGYYAQCDHANPNGPQAGTAFFGGPKSSGPFNGMQAEHVRVPFANVTMVGLPEEVSDDQAILLSDIFPTGYFGCKLAEVGHGDTVAILGCGPVGQFAIASARLLGAGRILAVDTVPSRLEMALAQGAEVIDFNADDPVETIRELTGGIGVDRIIDAVGVDAESPHAGPASKEAAKQKKEFARELKEVAPETNPSGDTWKPGNAPSQALAWCVDAVAKAGTIAIIGVYPEQSRTFPIGKAMNKNLTINSGNCNHRKYIPDLIDLVRSGVIDPAKVLTNVEPLMSAIQAYEAFDRREAGWMKVELRPTSGQQAA